jgi:hypothetical protein
VLAFFELGLGWGGANFDDVDSACEFRKSFLKFLFVPIGSGARVPRSRFTTRVARASPSTSSAMMMIRTDFQGGDWVEWANEEIAEAEYDQGKWEKKISGVVPRFAGVPAYVTRQAVRRKPWLRDLRYWEEGWISK